MENMYNCPGPDNISPEFIYVCQFIISFPISYLFNQPLNTVIFTCDWKTVFYLQFLKN